MNLICFWYSLPWGESRKIHTTMHECNVKYEKIAHCTNQTRIHTKRAIRVRSRWFGGGQGWLGLGANTPYHYYRIVLEATYLGNWTFSAHALSDQTCLFLAAFADNQIHWKHKRENDCWSSAEQAQRYLSSSSVCPYAQWKEAGGGPGSGKELGALSSDNKLSKLQTTNYFSSEYPWRTRGWTRCLRAKRRKYREVVKMSSQTMRDDCAMSTVEHWAKNTQKSLKF